MARDDRPLPEVPTARGALPGQVRAAGVLVGVQALAAAVSTAALVVRAGTSPAGVGPVLGGATFFLLLVVALGAVAAGLLTGRHWARTPALVTQLLLLPVVYSLLSSGRLVVGLAAGALVFAAFMLLVNEHTRRWSMGVDPADDR